MRVVVPGEVVGVIEQYLPGEGTFVEDGQIISCFLGKLDVQDHKASVFPFKRADLPLKPGSLVIGRVWESERSQSSVKLFFLWEPLKSRLKSPVLAIMHKRIPENRGALPGDIVMAKVVLNTGSDLFISLARSTKLGVIRAECTKCHKKLNKVGYALICPVCQKVYLDRKISDLYGLNPFKEK